jgi:hypothetical protein
MPIVQFHPEHGIRQGLHDRPFNGNYLFFGHGSSFPEDPSDDKDYLGFTSPFLMNPS